MTLRPLTRSEVRSLDQKAAVKLGLSTLVLMENAGRGAAESLREQASPGSRVLIMCGSGNNGGDGGVVARHLDAWDFRVHIVWFGSPERFSNDARVQFGILEKAGILQTVIDGPVDVAALEQQLHGSDWVVDGLLGTGLTRPVEGPLKEVIETVNRSGKPVLALDLPSGLDADTGQPQGIAIHATATATFVAPKIGFTKAGAGSYTGPVRVVEIGVPRLLLEEFRSGSV